MVLVGAGEGGLGGDDVWDAGNGFLGCTEIVGLGRHVHARPSHIMDFLLPRLGLYAFCASTLVSTDRSLANIASNEWWWNKYLVPKQAFWDSGRDHYGSTGLNRRLACPFASCILSVAVCLVCLLGE
jgi:hypothetical protein